MDALLHNGVPACSSAGFKTARVPRDTDFTALSRPNAEPAAKKKRTWEYVDITMLYNVLSNVMDGFSTNSIVTSRNANGSHDNHRMKILACLIGFTGTDFTRSLPHLSPAKIWDALSHKHIWFGLLRSFDYSTDRLVVEDACNILIAHLYKNNFPKHTHGTDLKSVLSSLQSSKLSVRYHQWCTRGEGSTRVVGSESRYIPTENPITNVIVYQNVLFCE
jgi:hypothetical protein